MKRILHITPDFNYSCGRSKLVFSYLKHFNQHKNYEVHFITNGGDSIDRLKDLPEIKYDTLRFSTGINNILYSRSFARSFEKYVLANGINLIHTHHRFLELIATNIGKKLNIRTVTSAHSFVKGYKKISFKSNKIICVSNSVSDYLMSHFKVPKEKINTLYNPIENLIELNKNLSAEFKLRHNIGDENNVLLFVGRINKDKGFDILIKSFRYLMTKDKSLKLIVNGELDNNKKDFNLNSDSNNLIFISPQKEISYLYSVADIVILPSRIDPFPFVMLEAGIFKKPFIGGNTGGIAEFIEDNVNGLLVDPENPEQLAEKIMYLLNNPDIGKIFGENLQNKVNRLCNHSNYFSEVEKIYNSLLSSQ